MNDQIATLVAQLKERRASTFQERIKSLDIRDEIWRKYVEFNKGASFDPIAAQRTGLAPDMCCERERLTREFQRLYKSYELDPDTRSLNHSLMITEYSRASADQAMPSPYDLRSGPVLLHTMNYLITNIMDKFEQGREQGDWYNFLWDRLRAIRKELTQQHLRDEIAVEILEQCARFHIFCSAFLSVYSRDLFDPNLNDKMLIDCLNQLRECYLTHKKQNNTQALRNIAEFSSYMLLINLKEDNETLLRIRHLIQDITEVPEIKVALNIHRSLILANTTKFFSLIENDATLLQSCLLHRYFNTIRSKRLNLLITSSRNNDEFRLSDLTDILGMDNDDETRDYLEQLGYSISNASPPSFIMTPLENQQPPLIKLSDKLIKTKYRENLKDIITGHLNTPVIIADNNIEDSFDLQGYFVGKLPFNTNTIAPVVLRKVAPEPQQPPQAKSSILSKRLPSESALRSMAAATTTTNTFFMKTRQTAQLNIFSDATTTIPTPVPSPFRFGGFNKNPASTVNTTTTRLFGSPSVPTRLVDLSPSPPSLVAHPPINSIQHIPTAVDRTPTPTLSQRTFSDIPERMVQPPAPPPVARRLSSNSMDTFTDELYDEMIGPLIRETAYNIYDELVSQWNSLTSQTITIFNELLLDEISSIAHDYYNDIEFHQKMLHDTLSEQNERKRKRYLRTKYFSLWLENATEAREERWILNELQMKYHFLNNEQLFEFLTGLQLMSEHDLTIEQTTAIFKSRRSIKKKRLRTVNALSNVFFDEFLREEFSSIVKESNDELHLRQTLLDSALKKQSIQRREHYLQLKYFSLWMSTTRRRKKLLKQQLSTAHRNNNNNKRNGKFLQLRSNKKLKENSQQYHTIKSSFDQLTADLNQIQLFIDQLSS